jgi:hypothetical protein
MRSNEDVAAQIDQHLACPDQIWLFGAGISVQANIPLMFPLTQRVIALLNGHPLYDIVEAITDILPEKSHIEHMLSHIGDYTALAERSRRQAIQIGSRACITADLAKLHKEIVTHIANTIRWGYCPKSDISEERFGQTGESIVTIKHHCDFINAMFGAAQAGLQDRRRPTYLFTTNYDTLLEDSLALAGVNYWDGFSGGAIAYRSHRFGQEVPASGYRAYVVKLHGSIDWYASDDGSVLRVRDQDPYPPRGTHVLIYPQATKYVATQRDPFAAQFELLRRAIVAPRDNTIAICGYSFGDEHINQEIATSLERRDNRSTLLAFTSGSSGLPECLETWRMGPWGNRVYILTSRGIYADRGGPYLEPPPGKEHHWWTFQGATTLLRDGIPGVSR